MLGEVEIFFNMENHSNKEAIIGDVMSHSLKTGIDSCFMDNFVFLSLFTPLFF